MLFRKFIILLIYVSLLFSPPVFAIDTAVTGEGFSQSEELLGTGKGSEYISGNYPGVVMMRVNIWGAIQKAGIHYIPAHTDLTTLLSYAGGPTSDAEMNNITVRRQGEGKFSSIKINFDDLIYHNKGENISLEPNDIIVIPISKPIISASTASFLATTASILAIILTSITINNLVKPTTPTLTK